MYRFDTGTIDVCENAWFLPEKTPYRIDERMEIIGPEGSIHIHETHPDFSVCDKDSWQSPDTTYWPMLHHLRSDVLREEFVYFANCILDGKEPSIIIPEEAIEAVRVCLAAEESAAKEQVVQV